MPFSPSDFDFLAPRGFIDGQPVGPTNFPHVYDAMQQAAAAIQRHQTQRERVDAIVDEIATEVQNLREIHAPTEQTALQRELAAERTWRARNDVNEATESIAQDMRWVYTILALLGEVVVTVALVANHHRHIAQAFVAAVFLTIFGLEVIRSKCYERLLCWFGSKRTFYQDSSEVTTMALPNRKFGCEIELYGLSRERARDVLTAALQTSVDLTGYNHRTGSSWKVTEDGSVTQGGFEIVSPILEGEAGLEEVRKVARALVHAGGRVNQSCGFHVHVDARDLSLETMLNIAKRYSKYESEIDAFMPRSRRSHNNSFCKPMSELFGQVDRGSYMAEYLGSKNRLGNVDRYYKVNIAAYARHGTVEFRQHSGTVDANKMANWIQFCLFFTEASIYREPNAVVNAPAPTPVMVTPASRTNALGRLNDYLRAELARNVADGSTAAYVYRSQMANVVYGTWDASLNGYHRNDVARDTMRRQERNIAGYITRLRREGASIRISHGAYIVRRVANLPSTSDLTAAQARLFTRLEKLYAFLAARPREIISRRLLCEAVGVSSWDQGRAIVPLVSKLRTTYGVMVRASYTSGGYRLTNDPQYSPAVINTRFRAMVRPVRPLRASTARRNNDADVNVTSFVRAPLRSDDNLWLDLPVELKNFYDERTMELAEQTARR